MNVSTITMPPEQAREQLRHYRRSIHRNADAEYQAAEKGYRALAKGTPLLNLTEVIAAAPCDGIGRPRLAVAQADRRQVHFHWRSSQTVAHFDSAWHWRDRSRRAAGLRHRIEMSRSCPAPSGRELEGYALVPLVPPGVRGNRALDAHFVLWEVEAWADQPIRAEADRDPYLLRHLAGDLYAVVGEWNLTDLERAIMAGRRQ